MAKQMGAKAPAKPERERQEETFNLEITRKIQQEKMFRTNRQTKPGPL